MKQKILIIILMLGMSLPYTFALGSRARAMGGAFIGLADDENSIFLNPAGLSQLDKTLWHVDVLMNSRNEFINDSLAYASQIYEGQPRKRFSVEEYLENEFQFATTRKRVSRYNFAISVNRDVKSKDFIKKIMNDRDARAQLGQMVAADTETDTYNLAFATKFPIARALFEKNEIYGGLNLKYQQTRRTLASLNTSNNKEVLNLGISTLIKTPHNFSFGATLDAILSEKLKGFTNTRGSSTNLSIGGSYRLDKSSVVAMDFTNVLNADRAPATQMKVGFERELIEDELALRLGSWDGTFTMGFGLKVFENMKVDYSFFNGDVLKEHYISAALPF